MGKFPCYRLNMKRLFLIISLLLALSTPVYASGVMPKSESSVVAARTAGVEIFVTSWCPYCRKLENFLKTNRIDYTRYDVEADAKGAAIFEKLGGEGVPMVRVGKIVIQGYDPERILAALQQK